MEINKVYNGKCLDVIKTFDDKSINSVITSPPYWQLRDYKWDGQWGLEPTFQMYLENLWSLMGEIFRVLRDDGTVWVNLGDTYGTKSGNFMGGNIIENKIKYTGGIDNYTKPENLHKCLLLIPHRFAIGCIDRGWIVRNDIIWAKRNGMPESVTDRFSKKHEYFFLMVKKEKYYFDLDGIRDKNITQENRPHGMVRNRLYDYDSKLNRMNGKRRQGTKYADGGRTAWTGEKSTEGNLNGKNPGSVSDFWDISKSYPNRKYFFTENYFETIDTEDKAYWLGFIWADGYLNENALEIELHISDKEQLENFKEDIYSTHKIYERVRPSTHACRLILGSQKLVSDLIVLGYPEKKIPNNIPQQLEHHFIRGLFDGDGSVGCYINQREKQRFWLELLGEYELMEWVAKRLNGIEMFEKLPKETRNIFRLSYADSDAAKFYDYVYADATRYMNRKKRKFPQELNYEYDFWDCPTQPSNDEHYAAYNDKLIGKPIVAGCPKDGIILDPFCGTATTGCRALELGRKFIGIEGSEKYVQIANKNLEPYLKRQQLF